jgi:hypothetical protein
MSSRHVSPHPKPLFVNARQASVVSTYDLICPQERTEALLVTVSGCMLAQNLEPRPPLQGKTELDRMRGVCRLVVVFATGLFKRDFDPCRYQTALPIGEHEIKRFDLDGETNKSVYVQVRG